VTLTATGPEPSTVVINVGGRVTFINNDVRGHDMVSDPELRHDECPPLNRVGFLAPGQSRQSGLFEGGAELWVSRPSATDSVHRTHRRALVSDKGGRSGATPSSTSTSAPEPLQGRRLREAPEHFEGREGHADELNGIAASKYGMIDGKNRPLDLAICCLVTT
jgi:hypothetical protein